MTRTLRLLGPLTTAALGAACLSQGGATLPPTQELAQGAEARPVARASLGEVAAPLSAQQVARALDGFGEWVDAPTYGRVWIPRVAQGFVPYGTDGRWVVSDAGWYWQSSLPWGAVTFHYGRWVQLDARWAWVPGSQFAPAWVDWRVGGAWVAWAPRAPRNAGWSAPFAFCPSAQALDGNVWQRVVTGAVAASLFPRTAPIQARRGHGGAVYAPGPTASEVPGAQPAPLGSVAVPVTILPRPGVGPVQAVALTGYAPESIPEEPVAQRDPSVDEAAQDARAPVRIRDVDLARDTRAGLSVVNLPPGARAALFAQRPARPVLSAPAPELAREEGPAPLPPPADVPLALRPFGGFGRRVAPARPYYASPVALPAAVGAPSSPGIGVSTSPPSAADGGGVAVVQGGGRAVGGLPAPVAVGGGQTAVPIVGMAPVVALPSAQSVVAR